MRGTRIKLRFKDQAQLTNYQQTMKKKYELQTKLKTSTLEKKWDRENT